MISPQVGGDGDTQLVIDKTATQLKCQLKQLVNLIQHEDHVSQSNGNDVAKIKQVYMYKHHVMYVVDNVYVLIEWIMGSQWFTDSC